MSKVSALHCCWHRVGITLHSTGEASILLLLVLDDLASEDDSMADPLPEHGAALLGHGHAHCSLGGTS